MVLGESGFVVGGKCDVDGPQRVTPAEEHENHKINKYHLPKKL